MGGKESVQVQGVRDPSESVRMFVASSLTAAGGEGLLVQWEAMKWPQYPEVQPL